MTARSAERTGHLFIVSGPGGVGKGTIVGALVQRDPTLWLSRSWTTRAQRPGERDDAYVFTDRAAFERRIERSGFLEWTNFLGNYYGTPIPEVDAGRDVVLEIEVDGARQVKALQPEAILIFVLPPSREEQQRRLRGRGDPEDKVDQRLQKALDEEPVGMAIADHVVVNDELERTVHEMAEIIDHHRTMH
ncbi:MAG: guanylate kinase [Actinomycetota bacterium]